MLEKENKDLKEKVYLLTEQMENFSAELQGSKLSKSKEASKSVSVNNQLQHKVTKKAAALALFTILNNNQLHNIRNIFYIMKFWIYKKSKLQEELEAKVRFKQIQQNFSHRTESLNEAKATSKKYFSQLLNLISLVNEQKPLEIDLSSCDLSKEWLELLIQTLDNNISVTEVFLYIA